MNEAERNHYAVLGISPDATAVLIKAAFRALAKQYHPDVHSGEDPVSTEKFTELHDAYKVLSNAAARKAYDKKLGFNKADDLSATVNEQKEARIEPDEIWNEAEKKYPEINRIHVQFCQISVPLANRFRLAILDGKNGDNPKALAARLEWEFFRKYFGEELSVQALAKRLLLRGNKLGAKELSEAVKSGKLQTKEQRERFLAKIERDYPDKVAPRKTRYQYDDGIFEQPNISAGKKTTQSNTESSSNQPDVSVRRSKAKSIGIVAAVVLSLPAVFFFFGWLFLVSKTEPGDAFGTTTTDQPQVPLVLVPRENANEITASKKQTYDRVIGDNEILGGQFGPRIEVDAAGGDPMIKPLLVPRSSADIDWWPRQLKQTSSGAVKYSPERNADGNKLYPEIKTDELPYVEGTVPSKKQINDRVIGNNEVLGGRILPTQATPVRPKTQPIDTVVTALSDKGSLLPEGENSKISREQVIISQDKGDAIDVKPPAQSQEDKLPLPTPPPPGLVNTDTTNQPVVPLVLVPPKDTNEPRDASSYLHRGIDRYNNSDYDQAIADFDRAIAFVPSDPNNIYIFVARAEALEKKGEWKRAVDDWHAAIANIPAGDAFRAEVKTRLATAEAMLANQKPVEPTVQPQLSPFRFGTRIALVIGNSAYQHVSPLDNPDNDAELMTTTLEKAGFKVTKLIDADRSTMDDAMIEFGRKLRSGADASLFYYSGHGIEVGGKNYLIPVDVAIQDVDELAFRGIDVNDFLETMKSSTSKVNIVVLDACRDNPFPSRSRGTSRGLALVIAPSGTLIAYSTAPGSVAEDGDGRNSPYTASLAESILHPGLTIEETFKQARVKVLKLSSQKQVPWESSSLAGDFFFIPAPLPPSVAPEQSSRMQPEQPSDLQDDASVPKKQIYDRVIGTAEVPGDALSTMQLPQAQDPSAGSGYFVQLASFKTEAEASAEVGRLKAKHASILASLPAAVNPAIVGGTTRYRLALGPLSTRELATDICRLLVAAGERDCLVRKQ